MTRNCLGGLALGLIATVARAEPQGLKLTTASSFLPGVGLLVRVEAQDADGGLDRDLWDAEATLSASPPGSQVTPSKVKLWNGIGSVLVSVAGDVDVEITASLGDLQASRTVKNLVGQPMSTATGTLAGPLVEWSGIVHVTGSVTVPAGVTLRLLPDTLVLVDGVVTDEDQPGDCASTSETPTLCGKSILVRGAIESMGTESEPVTITAAVLGRAWGEIHHSDAAPSFYENTIISRAGNSPRGGHTNTGPSIRATDSTIHFSRCSLADAAGKAMQATGSDLEFDDCLLTRCIMGPEIDSTALQFIRSYSLELHGSDDNDGIYLHSQRTGQIIDLKSCVIADGGDDGVDTLGSKITVEDCIVRDFANPNEDAKGVSVFSGDVTIRHCLVVGNKVGISAKSQNGGTATVHIERTSILESTEVALQTQDKFGEPDLRIRIFMDSSIARGPDAVKTDYPQFPDDIQITYSDLSEVWTGTGNITGNPLFLDAASGDFRLNGASPCIDAGNPSISPDVDGTRADLGYYPFFHSGVPIFARGRVNGDASVDISDPILLLFHLFAGADIGCEKAADANDDGGLDLTDAVFLLDYLFRDGPPPAAPFPTCAVETTDDALACTSPTCG